MRARFLARAIHVSDVSWISGQSIARGSAAAAARVMFSLRALSRFPGDLPSCFAYAPIWARRITFGGGGAKAAEDLLRRQKLRDKVEASRDARAKADAYRRSRDATPADDAPHPPPWIAPPPPTGVAAMAEAEIARAMAAGALDDLKGKGKPLARDAHSDVPWDVDAGQAALNRVLKQAGYKPASVEALDALRKANAAMEAARDAAAVAVGPEGTAADVVSGASVGRAHAAAEAAAKAYNAALLSDAENFGPGWPVVPAKVESIEEHAKKALERVKGR